MNDPVEKAREVLDAYLQARDARSRFDAHEVLKASADAHIDLLLEEVDRLRAENAQLREAMPYAAERRAVESALNAEDDGYDRSLIRTWLARLDAARATKGNEHA